jgi:hypothetical protein
MKEPGKNEAAQRTQIQVICRVARWSAFAPFQPFFEAVVYYRGLLWGNKTLLLPTSLARGESPAFLLEAKGVNIRIDSQLA